MRPELRTFRVNGHCLIGASLDMHVIVLQPDARTIANDVDFEADCMACFSLSEDGNLLAAAFAFESFCSIEVLDLRQRPIIRPEFREEATLLRIDRTHALDVKLTPNGETLFYRKLGAKSGTHAFHLPSGQQQMLANTMAPTNGAWLSDSVILPFRHSSGGIRISYWPLVADPVELPSKANVCRMTEHPSCETLALVDVDGQVAGLRAETLESLWRRHIPNADWISYSGDGGYIAVRQNAPAGGPVARTVMLDAESGKIARTVEQPLEQALYPLDGPCFLCYSGRFLNAETGEFEEGVSSPGFWEKILARKP